MSELTNTCTFVPAWQGVCGEPANEQHRCEKHAVACCSCGKPATHECNETMQFVCGAPLCDDCTHTIQDNGCNSGGKLPPGMKSHCRKDEQVYEPWYVRETEKDKLADAKKGVLLFATAQASPLTPAEKAQEIIDAIDTYIALCRKPVDVTDLKALRAHNAAIHEADYAVNTALNYAYDVAKKLIEHETQLTSSHSSND